MCDKCKSDNVTTFRDANLYFKTWGPLNIKNYINAELVYLCNECQTALVLIHIHSDYSRWNRSTAHYPELRVGYTKDYVRRMEEFEEFRRNSILLSDMHWDGFSEYVSNRKGNFWELEKVPVREYRIKDLILECSETAGECKIDPFTCKWCGQAAHDRMEEHCGKGHGFKFDECPKRIRDRIMYVKLHGHEVEV